MFSLIDAVLLRSLPYGDASRLVTIYETKPSAKIDLSGVAPVRVEEWNRMSESLSALAGVETENADRHFREFA